MGDIQSFGVEWVNEAGRMGEQGKAIPDNVVRRILQPVNSYPITYRAGVFELSFDIWKLSDELVEFLFGSQIVSLRV